MYSFQVEGYHEISDIPVKRHRSVMYDIVPSNVSFTNFFLLTTILRSNVFLYSTPAVAPMYCLLAIVKLYLLHYIVFILLFAA